MPPESDPDAPDPDALRRAELDALLLSDEEPERLRLKVEALLELEKIKLERDKNALEQEQHAMDKRRWWANPLIAAASVAALSLLGDMVISGIQGRNALLLQKQEASSDLIVKAFNSDVEQTLANMNFLISAGLIEADGDKIIEAAEQYRPRSDAPAPAEPSRATMRLLKPVQLTGRLSHVLDGDSVRVHLDEQSLQDPLVQSMRLRDEGLVAFSLEISDAPELRGPVCREVLQPKQEVWAEQAKAFTETQVGPPDSPVRLVVFGLLLGNPRGLLITGETPELDAVTAFNRSVNHGLLDAGLAIPFFIDGHPKRLIGAAQGVAARAEARGTGMYADLDRRFDPAASDPGLLSPWAYRRMCRALRSSPTDITGYMARFFREGSGPAYVASDEPLKVEDMFAQEDGVLRQLIPMRDIYFR